MTSKEHHTFVITGFRRDINEICALLGYYAASCGNPLPTFRDSVSVPSSRAKKSKKTWPLNMGPIRYPETSVKDYHSTLRNTPEECRSQHHTFVINNRHWAISPYSLIPNYDHYRALYITHQHASTVWWSRESLTSFILYIIKPAFYSVLYNIYTTEICIIRQYLLQTQPFGMLRFTFFLNWWPYDGRHGWNILPFVMW